MGRSTHEPFVLAFALAIGGCDGRAAPEAADPSPVPERTEALRPPDARGEIPSEAHVVDYQLDAVLDHPNHRITGNARIVWRNRSRQSVDRIPMHLYMNAFRADDTAWMREAGGTHRGESQDREYPWGYCDVRSIDRVRPGQGSDRTDLTNALTFAEGEDPSVMEVTLDEPVPPGGEIELAVKFETQLPKVFARTGFADEFTMAAQWFPKVAVLGPDGTWDNHVFTLFSEFYADFGDYEVNLDVPSEMTVGASGILVEESIDGDRKRQRWRAQMVHDFAWTAAPDFVERTAEYEGIRIRELFAPEHADEMAIHLEAQIASFRSMEQRFGPYPWSTITIVQPPSEAGGAGGMEYPTLYTTSPVFEFPQWLDRLGFEERMSGAMTTVHEFGHQYFQGLLASNEFAQPWLDEGMNTMANALVYEDWFGRDPWLIRFAGHPLRGSDLLRVELGRVRGTDVVDRTAAEFDPRVGAYGSLTYRRTAAVMLTLRNLVGDEPFDRAMRAYVDRYRFRHPTGADLERTLVEVLGERVLLGKPDPDDPTTQEVSLDVANFLEQGLRSGRVIDYSVLRLAHRRLPTGAGWRRDPSGTLVGGDPPDATDLPDLPDEQVEGVVVLYRTGDFIVPVAVDIEFADDTTVRRIWDGRSRTATFSFPGRRVRKAVVDPEGQLLLETRRRDNGRATAEASSPRKLSRVTAELGQAATLSTLVVLGP